MEMINLSRVSEDTLKIDVKRNPRSWSVLASAIIKQYDKDVQSGKSDFFDKDWYDAMFALSTRYIKISKVDDKSRVDEIEMFYKTHSVLETCTKFGFTVNKLKYFLRLNGIKKNDSKRKKRL